MIVLYENIQYTYNYNDVMLYYYNLLPALNFNNIAIGLEPMLSQFMWMYTVNNLDQ